MNRSIRDLSAGNAAAAEPPPETPQADAHAVVPPPSMAAAAAVKAPTRGAQVPQDEDTQRLRRKRSWDEAGEEATQG